MGMGWIPQGSPNGHHVSCKRGTQSRYGKMLVSRLGDVATSHGDAHSSRGLGHGRDSPLGPLEGRWPHRCLGCGPVAPISDSWPPELGERRRLLL